MTLLAFVLFLFLTTEIKGENDVGFNASRHLSSGQKKQKQFSLFTIVTFPNSQCTTQASSSGITYGTCLSATECSDDSGTASGNCASGFGVCCYFKVSSCGASVTKNCTYIQNPGYSSAYTTSGSCSYSVTPLSSNICQLRLDFDKFVTTIGTTGKCTDSFLVTGPSDSNGYGRGGGICGTLTDQHMYVEQGRSTSATTLAFTLATTTTGATYNIKVTQIECSSTMRAPFDCNQYLTGASGFIKSYNYAGKLQLAGTAMSYCVRRESGYCSIAYNQVQGETIDTFQVDDATSAMWGMLLASPPAASYVEGWLNIHNTNSPGGAVWGTILSAGQASTTNGQVIQYQNFILNHVVPYPSQGATDNIGFYLQYTQQPCSNGMTALSG